MNEMQTAGVAGTQQVIRVAGRQFVNPDSALAQTALELLAAHVAAGTSGESAVCGYCGLYFPCPPAVHARMVVTAAGMDISAPVRLPEAATEPMPDSPVEQASAITPQRAPDAVIADDSEVVARDRVGAV